MTRSNVKHPNGRNSRAQCFASNTARTNECVCACVFSCVCAMMCFSRRHIRVYCGVRLYCEFETENFCTHQNSYIAPPKIQCVLRCVSVGYLVHNVISISFERVHNSHLSTSKIIRFDSIFYVCFMRCVVCAVCVMPQTYVLYIFL